MAVSFAEGLCIALFLAHMVDTPPTKQDAAAEEGDAAMDDEEDAPKQPTGTELKYKGVNFDR